jgi:proteic killer suppression protein
VIRTFRNKDTQAIFKGEFVRALDRQIQQRAREKLKYLDSAIDLRDLMIPPSNQLEVLKGDRQGQQSTETRSMSRSSITIEYSSIVRRHHGS